jgi:hypothetical protein
MKPWQWALVGFLLAGLGAAWFFATHERREREVPRPPSSAAQRDSLLAAQRLLERLGYPVRRLDSLQQPFDVAGPTLLIAPAPRGALLGGAPERIEAFVRGGGHLLVESELLPARDPLLERFGIERVGIDEDSMTHAWSRGSFAWRDPTASGSLRNVTRADLIAERPPLFLRLRGPHGLYSAEDPRWMLGEDEAAAALQIAVGDGLVTVLTGFAPLQNWEIGRYDHAEFLHWLAREGKTQEVLILRPWHGGALRWLGEHGWRALIVLALLLLALLWRALPRFGPVRGDDPPSRRRLLDHLAASGRLLWSRGARETLAAAARGTALARLRAEYPHAGLMPAPELARFLARRFGLDAHAATQLAGGATPTAPLAFIAQVRACRRVHAQLAQGRGRGQPDPLYDPQESP